MYLACVEIVCGNMMIWDSIHDEGYMSGNNGCSIGIRADVL